mmetsp:Transcript_18818/g.43772  ORF Transcript_18818/g.43772 Transcript_18818/m.43772 type:complete len:183 (+) Transcript_18818:1256-1804(+)
MDPPEVACGCCTNCASLGGSDADTTPATTPDTPPLVVTPNAAGEEPNPNLNGGEGAIDYSALYGSRGQHIAAKLAEVSSEVYVKDSSRAAAAEWIIKEDPMDMESSDPDLTQRWILTLMWYALDGPNWTYTNFRTGSDECEWDQIDCDSEGKVSGITLGKDHWMRNNRALSESHKNVLPFMQ